MELKTLQSEMIAAMKSKDKFRKETISSLVQAAKKLGIDNKCRDEVPEELVDQAILKELKTAKEMVDSCPADRTDLLEEYKKRHEIIAEYAPKLLDTPEEIEELVKSLGIELTAQNRGQIMGQLKGKCDMKVANQIVAKMLA